MPDAVEPVVVLDTREEAFDAQLQGLRVSVGPRSRSCICPFSCQRPHSALGLRTPDEAYFVRIELEKAT